MKIRQVSLSDSEAILSIYTYYIEHTSYSFEYSVPDISDFRERIKDIKAKYPYIVAVNGEEIIGYAYASESFGKRDAYKWNCGVSVYIKNEYKRLKIGSSLYKRLEELLSELGYVNLYAVIAGDNTVSQSFHEKAGYGLLARIPDTGYKMGKWNDVIFYYKNLNKHEDFPTEPKGITEINIKEIQI